MTDGIQKELEEKGKEMKHTKEGNGENKRDKEI
jgi:hypothetical protein